MHALSVTSTSGGVKSSYRTQLRAAVPACRGWSAGRHHAPHQPQVLFKARTGRHHAPHRLLVAGVIQGPDAVFAKRAWLGLRWRQPRVSALQVQPCSLRTHHRALGRRPSAVVAAAARGLVGVGCGAALAGDTPPTGHAGWAYGGVGTTAGRDEIPARAGWLVRRRKRENVRERRGHERACPLNKWCAVL